MATAQELQAQLLQKALLAKAAPQPETSLINRIGTSLYKGVANLAGMPADLERLGQYVGQKFDVRGQLGLPPRTDQSPTMADLPGGQEIQQKMQEAGIPFEEFRSRPGQIFGKGVEAVPTAMLMPVGGPAATVTGAIGSGMTSELAGQLTKGSKYEIPARIAGALAGGIPGQSIGNIVDRAGNLIAGKLTPQAQALKEIGVQPKLASQVSTNRGLQKLETVVGDMPGGFTKIQEAAQAAQADISQALEARAMRLGTASNAQAGGQALQKGGAEALNQFGLQENRNWDDFFNSFPANGRVSLPRTKYALDNVQHVMADLPQTEKVLVGEYLGRLKEAFYSDLQGLSKTGPGGAGIDSVKNMRSIVGEMIKQPPLMNDLGRGKLSELYAALTADIKEAALRQGSITGTHDILDKFNIATDFTREGHLFAENTLSRIMDKSGGITPEQAAGWVLNQTKQGTTQLAQLRSRMPADDWHQFVSLMVRKLGTPAGTAEASVENFNPASFATNYKKLPDDVKSLLFTGTPYAKLGNDLEAFNTVSQNIQNVSKLANNSRTAGTAWLMNLMTGGGIAGGGLAGALTGDASAMAGSAATGAAVSVASPWFMGKLLTSPKFIRWAAAPTSLGEVPFKLRELAAIGASTPEISDAVNEYLKAASTAAQGQNQSAGQSQTP